MAYTHTYTHPHTHTQIAQHSAWHMLSSKSTLSSYNFSVLEQLKNICSLGLQKFLKKLSETCVFFEEQIFSLVLVCYGSWVRFSGKFSSPSCILKNFLYNCNDVPFLFFSFSPFLISYFLVAYEWSNVAGGVGFSLGTTGKAGPAKRAGFRSPEPCGWLQKPDHNA